MHWQSCNAGGLLKSAKVWDKAAPPFTHAGSVFSGLVTVGIGPEDPVSGASCPHPTNSRTWPAFPFQPLEAAQEIKLLHQGISDLVSEQPPRPIAHESGWPMGLAAMERNLPDEIS